MQENTSRTFFYFTAGIGRCKQKVHCHTLAPFRLPRYPGHRSCHETHNAIFDAPQELDLPAHPPEAYMPL